MKSRMMVSLALASLSLIFSAGCSTPFSKKKSAETAQAKDAEALYVVGTHYATVVFNMGKSSLSSADKQLLRDLNLRALKSKRPIEEIRILAWADQEYPENSEDTAKKSDIKLASKRAIEIKEFLVNELKTQDDIDSFNMAKRPNLASQLFESDEYEVKNAFEVSGATASRLPDGSVSYTKASKALVIIDYEDDQDDTK